jgi:hypothetical protein
MILDDITDYLSSGGVGTVGTNLFKGFLPESPDAATVVYETGGSAPVHAMNPLAGQAVVELPSVQVVCRDVAYEYATARATAHSVFKLLSGLPTRSINGTAYKWGAARQSPFLMGRDEAGRVLIACNYDIVKEVSA